MGAKEYAEEGCEWHTRGRVLGGTASYELFVKVAVPSFCFPVKHAISRNCKNLTQKWDYQHLALEKKQMWVAEFLNRLASLQAGLASDFKSGNGA